jgi:plastocyanin domain-containing protein
MLSLILLVSACSKREDRSASPREAPLTAGTVQPDGARRIAIEAGQDGYVPSRIAGKPGERLLLVFTRTVDGECLRELKTPDGKLVELPMKRPVEVAVTVPADGEIGFACGMDMFKGVIVAQPAG